ncbi:MAG: hypothetical protein J6E48_00225 [Prevotella sp.]|jgi:hypothetical protein|nr:hypothetical protein [Prevotella sp.]
MKKRKIALIGLASLLALDLLMPTKIQNPVDWYGWLKAVVKGWKYIKF